MYTVYTSIIIWSYSEPSPDWIVGVSGLELCLKNCSWIEHKVLNLYPWDAGTDSGVTYIVSIRIKNSCILLRVYAFHA